MKRSPMNAHLFVESDARGTPPRVPAPAPPPAAAPVAAAPRRLSADEEARYLRRDIAAMQQKAQQRAAFDAERAALEQEIVTLGSVNNAREWARTVNGPPRAFDAPTPGAIVPLPPIGGSGWYLEPNTPSVAMRQQAAQQAAAAAAELGSEYRALSSESADLAARIDDCDLATDPQALAVWMARKAVLDRYMPPKLAARDQAQRTADQTANAVRQAEWMLADARTLQARIIFCQPDDIETMSLGLGRAMELLDEIGQAITILSGEPQPRYRLLVVAE